ncbi:MAG: hypothetical protein Q8M07_01610, partial [Prosthecobacter sp.]|nr:hypothetical protein [Prosthecobacter sp.]
MGSSTAALFGKAILAAPSAMLLTTPARHIIAANAAASQLFGEIANSLNGVPVRKLYAVAEDWADSNAAIAAARPGTIPALLTVTLIRLPRDMFDAEVTLIPAYDRKNHLVSIIEIIAPVCAPRSLTQQPQHENASSDAVRLARGAAHDLKNLLAIIKGNVELSQSAVRPNDARVFLREAEDAC